MAFCYSLIGTSVPLVNSRFLDVAASVFGLIQRHLQIDSSLQNDAIECSGETRSMREVNRTVIRFEDATPPCMAEKRSARSISVFQVGALPTTRTISSSSWTSPWQLAQRRSHLSSSVLIRSHFKAAIVALTPNSFLDGSRW